MTLVKFNKRNQHPAFGNFFDRFFDSENNLLSNDWTNSNPAVNIKETDNSFLLELAAPGFKKSDFNVNVENEVLTISAEHNTENESKEENYTRREFGYSSFKRSFTLPESVNSDKIDGKYDNGVLNITIPKKEEAKVKPSQSINIS